MTNPKTGKQFNSELIHDLLSDCYKKEKFDKEFLDAVYIEDEHFAKWCINKNIPLPAFWFPNGWKPIDFEDQKVDTPLPRSNQIDKIVCQAIPRTLWDISQYDNR